MALNWARLPITHFEKWARAIKFTTPAFFRNEEPDPEAAAAMLNAESIRRKVSMGADKSECSYALNTMHEFLLAEEERYQKAHESLNRAIELEKQAEAHLFAAKSMAVDSGVKMDERTAVFSPDAAKKRQASLKSQLEYSYATNGALSPEMKFDTPVEEQLIFLHDFNYCGKKLFRIEEQLTHELALTHIEGVLAQFFKLPYQTICVHIPYNQVVRIHNMPVVWCYLSEYEQEDGRHIHVMYITTDGFPSFFEFVLDDAQTLGSQVKGQVNEKYGKEAAKEHMAVFSMIASMVLYINSEDRDMRILQPRVTTPKTDSRIPACSVGGTIKVNRSLSMSVNEDGSHTEHTMHVLKWSVRGHFRNQAHGVGMKQRKIIWVRPYLKGRERANEKAALKPGEYTIESITPNQPPEQP